MRKAVLTVFCLALLAAALQAVWAGAQNKMQRVLDAPPVTSQPVNPVR